MKKLIVPLLLGASFFIAFITMAQIVAVGQSSQPVMMIKLAAPGAGNAHLHIGGDPTSLGATSTSDVIFQNIDEYGTKDADAGPTTVLSQPSLLILDPNDDDRLFGVPYGPIKSALGGQISSFVVEGGFLKIKDSNSPSKEYSVALSSLGDSLKLSMTSLYMNDGKLLSNRRVNLDGNMLTFGGPNRDFSLGANSFKITDLTDKTGKTNATLTSNSLELNAGDKKGAIISRKAGDSAPLIIGNTGSAGIDIDVDNDGTYDGRYQKGTFSINNADNTGTLLLRKNPGNDGDAIFETTGASWNDWHFISGLSKNKNLKLAVSMEGRIILPSYGETPNNFPGDPQKDNFLVFNEDGVINEVTPEAMLAKSALGHKDQSLNGNRTVFLNDKDLNIASSNAEYKFSGSDPSIFSIESQSDARASNLSQSALSFVTTTNDRGGLNRADNSDAPLKIFNDGSGGIVLDTNHDSIPEFIFNASEMKIRVSNSGSGEFFSIARTDKQDGDVRISNGGTGSFLLNAGNKKTAQLIIDSAGQIVLPYYGKNAFPADSSNASMDKILGIAPSGHLREFSAKTFMQSISPSSLGNNDQTLMSDRNVDLNAKQLNITGKAANYIFGDDDKFIIKNKSNAHGVELWRYGIEFTTTSDTQRSGLSRAGEDDKALKLYNAGSGGIVLDADNDSKNDVAFKPSEIQLNNVDGSGSLNLFRGGGIDGNTAITTTDKGSLEFKINSSSTPQLAVNSVGGVALGGYGQNNFPGDVEKAYILGVDANGFLREFKESSLSNTNDKPLAKADQVVTSNRIIDIDTYNLNVDGDFYQYGFSGRTSGFTVKKKTGEGSANLLASAFWFKTHRGDATGYYPSGPDGAFVIFNENPSGVQFDTNSDYESEFFFRQSEMLMKSSDGSGSVSLSRADGIDGNTAITTTGKGSLEFKINSSSTPQLAVNSVGGVTLGSYGQNNFPGDAAKAYLLGVDANGVVREFKESSLFDMYDKSLGNNDLTLMADRNIDLNAKQLNITGKMANYIFGGDDKFIIKNKSNAHGVELWRYGIEFTTASDKQRSGLSRTGDDDSALKLYNAGSGGIALDVNNDSKNDVVFGPSGKMMMTEGASMTMAEGASIMMARGDVELSVYADNTPNVDGLVEFSSKSNITGTVDVRNLFKVGENSGYGVENTETGMLLLTPNGSFDIYLETIRKSLRDDFILRNAGLGHYLFNPGNSGKDKFEIQSDGRIVMPYYGQSKANFPGNLASGNLLFVDHTWNSTVDSSSRVTEIGVADVQKKILSMMPFLATDDPWISNNRKIKLADGKKLTIEGSGLNWESRHHKISLGMPGGQTGIVFNEDEREDYSKFTMRNWSSSEKESRYFEFGYSAETALNIYTDGRVKLSSYGKTPSKFPGSLAFDQLLMVNSNGDIREFPGSDFYGLLRKNLAVTSQKLSTDRNVFLGNQTLSISGSSVNYVFDDGGISAWKKAADQKIVFSPSGIDFKDSAGKKYSGIGVKSQEDQALRFYGTAGINIEAADRKYNFTKSGLMIHDANLSGKTNWFRETDYNGSGHFANDGTISFDLETPLGKPFSEFMINLDGSVDMPYYREGSPYNGGIYYALAIDENGTLTSLDLKNLHLGVADQKLTSNRLVDLDNKTLTFAGNYYEQVIGGSDDKFTIKNVITEGRAEMWRNGLQFINVNDKESGLYRGGEDDGKFKFANDGSGGIVLDTNNNSKNDFIFNKFQMSINSQDEKGTLTLTRDNSQDGFAKIINTGKGGFLFQSLGEASSHQTSFTPGRLNMSTPGGGGFVLERADSKDGSLHFRNLGLGDYNFNPGDVGESTLVMREDGGIVLPFYGKNGKFQGDLTKDTYLMVNAQGEIRQLADLAKGGFVRNRARTNSTRINSALINRALSQVSENESFIDLNGNNLSISDASDRFLKFDKKEEVFFIQNGPAAHNKMSSQNVRFYNEETKKYAAINYNPAGYLELLNSHKSGVIFDVGGGIQRFVFESDQMHISNNGTLRFSLGNTDNAASVISNTGSLGFAFDIASDGEYDATFETSKLSVHSPGGHFYLRRGPEKNDPSQYVGTGSGGLTINTDNAGQNELEIKSSGQIRFPYYGKTTPKFKGDLEKDRVLGVDKDGNIRAIDINEVMQNSSKIISATDQKLLGDRIIDVATKAGQLRFRSKTNDFVFSAEGGVDPGLKVVNEAQKTNLNLGAYGFSVSGIYNLKKDKGASVLRLNTLNDLKTVAFDADNDSKYNVILSKEDMQIKSSDAQGALIVRRENSTTGETKFTSAGTRAFSFNFDVNGMNKVSFEPSKILIDNPNDGRFSIEMANIENGSVTFAGSSADSFNFNLGGKPSNALEIQSDGGIVLPNYGRSRFNGNASSDRILVVNSSGAVRSISVASLESQISSATPQTLRRRQSVNGMHMLNFDSQTANLRFGATHDDDALFIKARSNSQKIAMRPYAVEFTSDEERSGLHRAVHAGSELKLYNTGTGGILFDTDNDSNANFTFNKSEVTIKSIDGTGALSISRADGHADIRNSGAGSLRFSNSRHEEVPQFVIHSTGALQIPYYGKGKFDSEMQTDSLLGYRKFPEKASDPVTLKKIPVFSKKIMMEGTAGNKKQMVPANGIILKNSSYDAEENSYFFAGIDNANNVEKSVYFHNTGNGSIEFGFDGDGITTEAEVALSMDAQNGVSLPAYQDNKFSYPKIQTVGDYDEYENAYFLTTDKNDKDTRYEDMYKVSHAKVDNVLGLMEKHILLRSWEDGSDVTKVRDDTPLNGKGMDILRKFQISNTGNSHRKDHLKFHGAISREIQTIDPGLMTLASKTKKNEEHLMVDKASVLFIMVDALQGADAELTALRARVESSKRRVETLEGVR